MRASLTLSKLIIFIILLTWINTDAVAQQDTAKKDDATQVSGDVAAEESPVGKSSKETSSDSTESESTQNTLPEDTPTPPPISLSQQYKNDLTHYLPTKNVKPLLAGTDDYITLVTENTSINSKGVAILLPDWQQGATNPKAINFLRNQLPQHGWTTISIQPTEKPENYPSSAIKIDVQQEENQTVINDYKIKLATMINAVLSEAKDYPGIVMIIAQGNHGAILVDLLSQNGEQPNINQVPNALILLSSYVLTNEKLIDKANTDFAKKLAASEYPVLDLYLKKDNHFALYKAKERLLLSKQEMKVYYRQRQLNNSAMGYYPETELLTQVNSWLKSIGW